MKEITVNGNDAGQRTDKFISKALPALPVSLLYKYIRTKRIKVNGKRVKENHILCKGDVVTLFVPEEFLEQNRENAFTRVKAAVETRYEDENVIIVRKPKGLLCHSESPEDTDTLIDRVKAYLYNKGEYVPERENSFAPALCNRIDRNTEGLVIAAKNAAALREMNEIIRRREVKKFYLAACHGLFARKKGEIKSFLEKDAANNTVTVREKPNKNTLTAVTRYEVTRENREKSLSLLTIELLTGRTHQIRAQLAHIGHPLLGESKYAVNKEDRKMGYSSQALCSYSLRFEFASTDDKPTLAYLNGVEVTAERPDFVKLFEK